MAATTDLDTASAVLAAARERRSVADRAESEQFQLAADWAAMHSVDSLGPAAVWEGELPIAGDGAPLVAEFRVAEFALAIGKSTDAGRAYLGEAVEVRHRLQQTIETVRLRPHHRLRTWRTDLLLQPRTALCRFHHRLKTHGGWTYERLGPRTFAWTSPHGHVYLRDDEDRRHI